MNEGDFQSLALIDGGRFSNPPKPTIYLHDLVGRKVQTQNGKARGRHIGESSTVTQTKTCISSNIYYNFRHHLLKDSIERLQQMLYTDTYISMTFNIPISGFYFYLMAFSKCMTRFLFGVPVAECRKKKVSFRTINLSIDRNEVCKDLLKFISYHLSEEQAKVFHATINVDSITENEAMRYIYCFDPTFSRWIEIEEFLYLRDDSARQMMEGMFPSARKRRNIPSIEDFELDRDFKRNRWIDSGEIKLIGSSPYVRAKEEFDNDSLSLLDQRSSNLLTYEETTRSTGTQPSFENKVLEPRKSFVRSVDDLARYFSEVLSPEEYRELFDKVALKVFYRNTSNTNLKIKVDLIEREDRERDRYQSFRPLDMDNKEIAEVDFTDGTSVVTI